MRLTSRTALLLIVFSAAVSAENWPAWRGPYGTSVSPDSGVPTEWSNTANIAWKTPLRGMGVSSPIVWGGRVFVTYQIGRGTMRPGRHPSLVQGGDPASSGEVALGGSRPEGDGDTYVTFVVAAFGVGDGGLLWEHEISAERALPEVHQKSNMASPSPVTDGERVYAWFSTGQLAALDMDGKPVWQRHIGQDYSVFDISWGHGSSPTLHDDLLILICFHNSASYLLALDKRTGEQVWKTDRDAKATSYSTPAIVEGPTGPDARSFDFDPDPVRQCWQRPAGCHRCRQLSKFRKVRPAERQLGSRQYFLRLWVGHGTCSPCTKHELPASD